MSADTDAEAMRNARRVFGGLFLLIGLVAIIGGVAWLVRTARFSQKAHRATATIVAIDESRGSRGSGRYPSYSFEDEKGVGHSKRSAFSLDGEGQSWAVGRTVEVLYDPADPERSVLNAFGQLWLTPISFTGFAVLWTLVVAWVERSK